MLPGQESPAAPAQVPASAAGAMHLLIEAGLNPIG